MKDDVTRRLGIRRRVFALRRAAGVSRRRMLVDELDEIALHCSTLPVRDAREAEEILGYNEHGLPT